MGAIKKNNITKKNLNLTRLMAIFSVLGINFGNYTVIITCIN